MTGDTLHKPIFFFLFHNFSSELLVAQQLTVIIKRIIVSKMLLFLLLWTSDTKIQQNLAYPFKVIWTIKNNKMKKILELFNFKLIIFF